MEFICSFKTALHICSSFKIQHSSPSCSSDKYPLIFQGQLKHLLQLAFLLSSGTNCLSLLFSCILIERALFLHSLCWEVVFLIMDLVVLGMIIPKPEHVQEWKRVSLPRLLCWEPWGARLHQTGCSNRQPQRLITSAGTMCFLLKPLPRCESAHCPFLGTQTDLSCI